MRVWVTCVALWCATAVQADTLADVRSDLDQFLRDLDGLRLELEVSRADNPAFAGSVLDRVNSMEQQLRRLTDVTEQLEFRIRQQDRAGRGAVQSLTARLCGLDPACTPDAMVQDPDLDQPEMAPEPVADTPVPVIASQSEQSALARAETLLVAGDLTGALSGLDHFFETYPSSVLAPQAHLFRGTVFAERQDFPAATRAYLDAYVADADGTTAPDALYGMTTGFIGLGQTEQACAMLTEIAVQFPQSDAALAANDRADALECP
ncbi:MAG: hypothetical protein AAF386_01715 [Pseudomonadota bacterium]